MTVCSGRLFLSDFCVILKASVSCQCAFLGSFEWVLTDIERTSGNMCPAHCCSRQPGVCVLTSSWGKRERRKHRCLWSSSAPSLFQRHDYIMERDTDAPGSIAWTTASLLKMPSWQGLGPVMLKRGPIHWSAHITPEIIKNTNAGTPPGCNESGSRGLGPASCASARVLHNEVWEANQWVWAIGLMNTVTVLWNLKSTVLALLASTPLFTVNFYLNTSFFFSW